MSDHTNIYFFNAQEALKTALEQNPVPTDNPDIHGLQICYYNAEAPLENTPENCIWVPLEDVYNYFVTTKNRFPQNLSFFNTEYSTDNQNELTSVFDNIIQTARYERTRLKEILAEEIHQYQPDFNEKPWRVFVPACRETKVMQYVSKNIANAFEELGYEVKYFIQDNAMQSCKDTLPLLHAIYEFKPHITVNINHLVHSFLHPDVFNFVWFHDMMPTLTDNSIIKSRKRDTIFHLVESIENALITKNITSLHQPFCINTTLFKERAEIKKENKIVLIGSSYQNRVPKNIMNTKIYKEIKSIMDETGTLTSEERATLVKKYSTTLEAVGDIFGYILRDTYTLELCQANLDYDIEIYGFGWDQYKELKPFYKGALSYGEEVSKVYNSAKFCFAPGGYILQQRVFEGAASGAIPIVYDNRYSENSPQLKQLEENLVMFQKICDLPSLLKNQEYKRENLNELIKEHTYLDFTKRMIHIVEDKLQHD